MSFDTVAIVIMSKFPTPGKVKTRLTPVLSPEQAAAVHRVFLLHLVRRFCDLGPAELVICFDPPDARSAMADLLSQCGVVTLHPQVSGDLGHRLADAATTTLQRHRSVLITAVDSPDVPTTHVQHAASLMSRAQVSLSPATDGGYWSLGLTQEVNAKALLHTGIDWSTERAAEQTLANARSLGYSTATGEMWDDVDQPANLMALMERLDQSCEPSNLELRSELRRIL